MPDWLREAWRKLAGSKFSAEERDDISRELAGYLDDLCTDARSRGLDESAATERAFAELHHDARLGSKLYRARKENPMHLNDRTKGFWLPGLLSLVASVVLLAIFQIVGLRPRLVGHFGSVVNYFPVMISLPWLCVLPFLGAASAYFSRRAGRGRALRVTAGVFPALVFLAAILVVVPLSFGISGVPGINAILPAIATGALSWAVIPGAALLLGVLPFLRSAAARHRDLGAAA